MAQQTFDTCKLCLENYILTHGFNEESNLIHSLMSLNTLVRTLNNADLQNILWDNTKLLLDLQKLGFSPSTSDTILNFLDRPFRLDKLLQRLYRRASRVFTLFFI